MSELLTESQAGSHPGDVALASHSTAPSLDEAPPDPIVPEFREIYDQHFDFVYRSARRLGVPERSLDDAAQDVFLVVHRRLEGFEGRSSVKTWLYGITRRVAKDHRRRAGRKESGQVPADDLAAMEQSPAEDAARRQAADLLESILAGLDAGKREVFILAEVEQMTVPEISEALSMNLNTAYSRLRVARAEFEKAVARHLAKAETHA